MGYLRRRTLGELLCGLFWLCHPIPVFFYALAVLLMALLASWPHPDARVLLLLVGAHTAMQVSIAVLNDYCDRRLDAVSKRTKPLVRGWVRPSEALLLGLFCLVLMFVLLLFLPPLALFFSLLYLTLSQAYELGLKATPWSGFVFALAIPLIPVYAFVGAGHPSPRLFWFIPVAALLGGVLNLANLLPDIEDGAAQNVRTLVVVVGIRGALLLCPLLMMVAIVLTVVLAIANLVPVHPGLFMGTLMIQIFLLLLLYRRFDLALVNNLQRKIYCFFVVVACIFFSIGWLSSILLAIY
jgi:4-hydroxybenzoate polyprenyltransferase